MRIKSGRLYSGDNQNPVGVIGPQFAAFVIRAWAWKDGAVSG